MAVNIVAKYFNPTLLESFTAPAMTLAGSSDISDAEVSDQCTGVASPLWECPGYPEPNSWCYPYTSLTDCRLFAYYTLPTLLRPGKWSLSIALTLDSAGTPPDPFDPDTECYWDCFWGCNGYGFELPEGGTTPTWPVGPGGSPEQIDFIDGATGLCDYTDTFLSITFDIGISDNLYVCRCGATGIPEISFARGGGISSYDVAISGTWLSDFPP